MLSSRTLAVVAVGLLLDIPGAARAQFVFTAIDVPGAAATYANGNSAHVIGGEFDDEDGNTHGFVLSGGVFTPFDAPDAEGYTSINGVSDSGERSGIYYAGGRYHGYVWSRRGFTTLDPP